MRGDRDAYERVPSLGVDAVRVRVLHAVHSGQDLFACVHVGPGRHITHTHHLINLNVSGPLKDGGSHDNGMMQSNPIQPLIL